jgi:hypothetical protein
MSTGWWLRRVRSAVTPSGVMRRTEVPCPSSDTPTDTPQSVPCRARWRWPATTRFRIQLCSAIEVLHQDWLNPHPVGGPNTLLISKDAPPCPARNTRGGLTSASRESRLDGDVGIAYFGVGNIGAQDDLARGWGACVDHPVRPPICLLRIGTSATVSAGWCDGRPEST